MDFNKGMKLIKEHYVKPMDSFYRDLYKKKFNEEPPRDSGLMMDRFIKCGDEDIAKIIKLSSF